MLAAADEEAGRAARELLSARAYMGSGLMNVTKVNGLVDLRLLTYNQARRLQGDALRTMTGMMKLGVCRSADHPLVVAVKRSSVKAESLAGAGAALKPVRFAGAGTKVPIEVLAGMHRVTAVRAASEHLRARLAKVEKLSSKAAAAKGPDSDDDDDERPAGPDRDVSAAYEAEEAASREVLERIETWPVKFYDLGKPSLPR